MQVVSDMFLFVLYYLYLIYLRNINDMILRNRLKERRAALGVNQHEMGKLCGVSRQTISLIERGDYSPSVTLALTIAKVCGVTVEEVFYLQEEEKDGK